MAKDVDVSPAFDADKLALRISGEVFESLMIRRWIDVGLYLYNAAMEPDPVGVTIMVAPELYVAFEPSTAFISPSVDDASTCADSTRARNCAIEVPTSPR